MQFDYEHYLRGCLLKPCAILICCCIILIPAAWKTIIKMRQGLLEQKQIISFCLLSLVCATFIFRNVGILLNGGMHLVYERENAAITVSGKIEKITELDENCFPRIKSDYEYSGANGVEFKIGTAICIGAAPGELEVGDNVTVTFLPNSKYVLFIEELGD